MTKQLAAVIGTGQTHHRAKREDVSMAGLCARRSTARWPTPQVGWDDIDAVVLGKAPDLFEGVMMPELFLADALGAVGQAAAARAHRRLGRRLDGDRRGQPGAGGRAPPRARRWRSRSSPSRTRCGRCRSRSPFNMPVAAGAGGYFAPHVRSYIRRSGAPDHVGAHRRGQGPPERR